jgi:alpha-D-ribose 1-methylphosphonate 5-triphosphate diphosphatase
MLGILSRDYYSISLLQAAWLLAGQDNGYDLPRAIATVSRAPAKAAGLDDRGEIRLGLRADLVQARVYAGQAVIQQVWRQAKRVF